MRLRAASGFVLAASAGVLQAASLASPWDAQPQWWLQIASLALLVWLLDRAAGWRQAALFGWAFATAWQCATWWWLFISMHTYGGLPAPLAIAAILALAGFLALDYALAFAFYPAAQRSGAGFRAIYFVALWTLAELARGFFYTGFPWGVGGYAHVDGPLADAAAVVGVYGLGAFAAFAAWSIANLRRLAGRFALSAAAVFAGVVAIVLAGQREWTTSTGVLSVSLLQGNISQSEKFQPSSGIPQALDWYAGRMSETRSALVVAPETAIPLLPLQLPPGYSDALAQRFASGGQAALFGIPLGDSQQGYSNSVLGLAPGQPAYRYDKHHLVPFGEFIPPLFRWFTQLMNIPLGDFNRGPATAPSFAWAGQRLAPNICYEDLFGEELGVRFADDASAPTVFVNVSNIGWFGNTVAIDQHLAISRMRAMEFQRPMIRATNTGSTAMIDHRGRVVHELPRHTRAVLNGAVEGRTGSTPYAWWVSRYGLWPLWALALLAALWPFFAARRRA